MRILRSSCGRFYLANCSLLDSYNDSFLWSDYVDELHKSARECFLLWRDTGKPRQGQVFNMMQQSRARFKYAIRAVKQRENALRRESLAKKMTNNSNCAFWKEIKKMNNVNTPLPNCIAGVWRK